MAATTGRMGWTGATAAAVGVNTPILALLSLEDRRVQMERLSAARSPLYLEMEPTPRLASPRFSAPAIGGVAREDAPPPFDSPRRPPLAPIDEDRSGAAPPTAPILGLSSEWLARRDALIAHGTPSDVRAGRRGPPNCAWPETLATTERRRCLDFAQARVDPREAPPQRSGDEDRNSVFAQEAAAKQRWRDYRAGAAEYPGLLSLMGKT
ncbi:hypothetical protein [Brevundimonas sp.]|uniref:hypothetical protein n=1 Tax=Brevundimonas sp. TaxID=1871086 RepID=UPI0037BF35C7